MSELLNILRAGAGITMEAAHYTVDDVMPVAREAARVGVTLRVHGAMEWRTADLINIATAGKGNVIFV